MLLMFGMRALRSNYRDPATMMAMVCLAAHLRTLEITASDTWSDTEFMLVKRSAGIVSHTVGPLYTLNELTTLIIHFARDNESPEGKAGIDLNKLNGLLYSTPNLEHLAIDRPKGGASDLSAQLPHLTVLKLTKALLCERALRLLTRGCHKPTHFELTHSPAGLGRCGLYHPVSPSQVLECLAPCRATLRKLHLAPFVPERHQARPLRKPYPLLTTLEGFSALREVAVDYRAIERRPGSHEALARLVWACKELEGLFLMGMKEVPVREFAFFTRCVVDKLRW
jgi:hypothetical protein